MNFTDELKKKLEGKPKKQATLFASRVVRLIYDKMDDPRSREAVDAAELWALGLIDDATLREKRDAAYAAYAASAAYASAAYAAYAADAYAAYAADATTQHVLKINPNLLPQIKEIYHNIFKETQI